MKYVLLSSFKRPLNTKQC